ncbi:MAG TPA: ATP-binding cassette domain-containing protein [Bacteroidota bacterium]|nr:ATP-binding cassette domain-containing protein [Bacteroidota bacterium]
MAIAVRNLTKFYGTEKAVNDISFDVKTGEILGFLGPNGAGKTTTMKIITCYMPPTSGSVEVEGMNIEQHSLEVRKKIGYLPEMNPLYLDMNVVEYLEYAASLHGLQGILLGSRLKEMIELCGIGDVRHKDIGELSKGYRQRVGLAQAMVHDPEVLILDEPTSGLDPNQIVEIRNLIRQLGRAKTVVLSTHILSEVQATCDRVIIINDGTIAADGTLEQLQNNFRGSEKISLELKAPVANAMTDIYPKLQSLASVETVQYDGEENGAHKFSLHTLKGSDIREAIFHQAVAEHWVLLELTRTATSLEEVFHKLTTGETAAIQPGQLKQSIGAA